MGFFDKIRDYLNEEENLTEEDIEKAESLVSSKKVKEDEEDIKKDNSKSKKSLFKRLKKKYEEEETDSDSEPKKSSGLSSIKAKKYMENERKTVQDFCEQLVDVSFHSEEIKNEYKVVTSYLTDIQRIEELPVDMANRIISISERIEKLDKNRETYLQSENLLSMEQYNTLSNYEDDVPETVKRLNEMEARDTALRSDMGYLEGEKEDLRYMRDEYTNIISRMRGVMITVMSVLLITSIGIMIYAFVTRSNITVYALGVGAIAMLIFVVAYAKYIDLKADIKDYDAKLKRAVSLLNKVKVKYINNTNTLDYIYEKYGVHSSQELSYQWEQYNIMVRDAKRYTHTNAEFKDRCDELVNIMKKIGVEDPFVWPKQTNALIDRREMVEIKHSLNVRRQKLRERLATCEKIKDNAHIALRAAVTANPGMESYITDMLQPYNLKIDLH